MRARLGMDRGAFTALASYLALIGVLDTVIPDPLLRLAPFAVLAPIVAAALLSLPMTAAVCALYLVLTGLDYGLEREERIKRLRLTAGAAQRLPLRSLPLQAGDVTADGFYEAAEREAMAGRPRGGAAAMAAHQGPQRRKGADVHRRDPRGAKPAG